MRHPRIAKHVGVLLLAIAGCGEPTPAPTTATPPSTPKAAAEAPQPRHLPKRIEDAELILLALHNETRRFIDELRIHGFPADEAVLDRLLDARATTRGGLDSTEAVAELAGQMDADLNTLLRRAETIEIALGADRVPRLLQRPDELHPLSGGEMAVPLIVTNEGRRAARVRLRLDDDETARVPPRRSLRRLLRLRDTGAGKAVFTLGIGDDTLAVDLALAPRPSVHVQFGVVDETGAPTPTRLHARAADRRAPRPVGTAARVTDKGDVYSYVPPEFSLVLPPGTAVLEFVKGHEYRVARVALEVEAGRFEAPIQVSLARWSNLAQAGWIAGEGHIHMHLRGRIPVTREDVRTMVLAEDLTVASLAVVGGSEGIFDAEHFEGRDSDLSSAQSFIRWNEEYRNQLYGHMILYGLTSLTDPVHSGYPRTPLAHHFPLNADVADQVLAQGGWVTGAHTTWGRDEHIIDLALDKMGGLEMVGYGVQFPAARRVLHGLWKAGFRIVPTAGTDAVLERRRGDPLGGGRLYAKIEGTPDSDAWVAAMKQGRVFVSNAPTLLLEADGRGPGATLTLPPEGGAVGVAIDARSQWPLDELVVFLDGEVVARAVPSPDDPTRITLRQDVVISRSGWLAAQVLGPSQPLVFGGPLFPNTPQFAHTGPIWIDVESRPAETAAGATALLDWARSYTEEIESKAGHFTDEQRDHMRAVFGAAREVYEARATP